MQQNTRMYGLQLQQNHTNFTNLNKNTISHSSQSYTI